MSKNQLTLQVRVAVRRLMPEVTEAGEWLLEQYERALEMAERQGDGTVTTFKAEYPCVQPEKIG